MADIIETLPLLEGADPLEALEYSKIATLLKKPRHVNKKRLLVHIILFFLLSLQHTDLLVETMIPATKTNKYLLTIVKTALFGTILYSVEDRLHL